MHKDEELPVILAGPVLRSCSSSGVHVWVATRTDLALKVLVYRIDAQTGAYDRKAALGSSGDPIKLQLGQNLFLQLLKATPLRRGASKGFPEEEILAYDVQLVTAGAKEGGSIFENLVERESVIYPPFQLPTFVLRGARRVQLHGLIGSCRKAGGTGPDATRALDAELTKRAALRHVRPTSLLLLGDQIYGDAIPTSLLPTVIKLASALRGEWARSVDSRTSIPDDPKLRTRLIGLGLDSNTTGFTVDPEAESTHAFDHMEYCVAHLLAWSPALWAWHEEPERPIRSGSRPAVLWPAPSLNEDPSTRELRDFSDATRSCRRVLANISSIMMFDDHDVTDDWNLDKEWESNCRPPGKAVTGQARVAYTAFQHLGNHTEHREDKRLDVVREFANVLANSAPRSRRTFASVVEASSREFASSGWSFIHGSGPPLLVLDTRTQRRNTPLQQIEIHRPDGVSVIPAPSNTQLLSKDEVNRCTALLSREAGDLCVVACAAPVVSQVRVDALGRQELLGKVKGRYELDLEDWMANPASLFSLLDILSASKKPMAIVLCGDVHHSFIASVDVRAGDRSFRLLQLTSSALKNVVPGYQSTLLAAADKIAGPEHFQAWWGDASSSQLRLFQHESADTDVFRALVKAHGEPSCSLMIRFHSLGSSLTGSSHIESRNTIGIVTVLPNLVALQLVATLPGSERHLPQLLATFPYQTS